MFREENVIMAQTNGNSIYIIIIMQSLDSDATKIAIYLHRRMEAWKVCKYVISVGKTRERKLSFVFHSKK